MMLQPGVSCPEDPTVDALVLGRHHEGYQQLARVGWSRRVEKRLVWLVCLRLFRPRRLLALRLEELEVDG